MLLATALVLIASLGVLIRLGHGHSVDLSQLRMQVISLGDGANQTQGSENASTAGQTASVQSADSAGAVAGPGGGAQGTQPNGASGESVGGSEGPRSTPSTVPAAPQARQATLTFGGTIAIEENIRKSGYVSDTKKYDFTDIFMLLKNEIQGQMAGAFFENLIIPQGKVSAIVAPEAGVELLTSAGFSMAFCGFSKAWEKSQSGILSTISALQGKGIQALGLCGTEADEPYRIQELGGIRVAIMQYTDTVVASTRKAMQKKGLTYMIPAADPVQIAEDIAAARAAGAEAVIVMLNWGKVGSQNPDKTQVKLAQQIAECGADLILGAGSRTPQKTESLITTDGRQVMCAYSLGTLLSDSRKSASRMGGYLMRVALTVSPEGNVSVRAEYVPTYTWKYRQDGRDAYRVVAADRAAPDGMASDQIKQMQKTLDAVQAALAGAPISIR